MPLTPVIVNVKRGDMKAVTLIDKKDYSNNIAGELFLFPSWISEGLDDKEMLAHHLYNLYLLAFNRGVTHGRKEKLEEFRSFLSDML